MPLMKASIGIYRHKVDYEKHESCPEVPDEIFQAAERVMTNKSTEIVKTTGGLYIVEYAEHGPLRRDGDQKFIPVWIARLEKWASGGITKKEHDAFLASRKTKEASIQDPHPQGVGFPSLKNP